MCPLEAVIWLERLPKVVVINLGIEERSPLLVGAVGVGYSCLAVLRVHVPMTLATGLEFQKTPRMRRGAIPSTCKASMPSQK